MGESCLLQFVGLFVALPCPLLKMLHTLVKHTQFLHRTAVAICSEGERKNTFSAEHTGDSSSSSSY